ncbi:MAG TPA: hypothetical protein EYN06_05930 [Myxococcales bacterium]|nr:hypothetical protein [Myxococcales bacterium]HIN86002.1 hypothetical protein [Myxococcales bacterium]
MLRARILIFFLYISMVSLILLACGDAPSVPGVSNPPPTDTGNQAKDQGTTSGTETTLIDLGPTPTDSDNDVIEFAYPPCETNGDCESGYCIDYEAGPSECSEICIENCPDEYMCKGLDTFGPDLTFVCVKDVSTPCKSCELNSDCGGSTDECVEIGGAKFCATTCESFLECDQAYGCVNGHCIPDTESCICTADIVGTKRTCENTNDVGTCYGVETCTGAAGWEDCTAPAATLEICDGIDNDCNGISDDGISDGAICQIENPNTGTSCPGKQVCMGVQGLQCDGDAPVEESCDGKDNDCDGVIDEGFTDTDGDKIADCQDPDIDGDGDLNANDCAPMDASIHQGALEVCDGKDNNCILGIDEGFLDTDSDNKANCVDEDDDDDGVIDTQDCAPLNNQVFPGNEELCNGLDENCNVKIDEGFGDLDADSIADCIDSDIDGDLDPNDSDCAPKNSTIHAAANEICDGIDNNCSAGIDENFSNTDGDALANCIDSDDDNDSILDNEDNCPLDFNPDQGDSDKDGIGDACDILEPGPLSKLDIVSAAGNLGESIASKALVVGDKVTLYAAGFDNQGLYLGEQPAYWTVGGTVDAVPYGPSPSIIFTALTANTNGMITATSTKAGVSSASTGIFTVSYAPVDPSVLENSLIYSDKTELATGTELTTVYVELVDAAGAEVETPFDVEISSTLGLLLGPVISLGGGVYKQSLQSGSVPGVAIISAQINGQLIQNSQTIDIIELIDLAKKGISKIDCTNYQQFEGKDILVTGGTITINTKGCGPITLGRLRVLNNSVLTHDGCSATPNRMELNVSELQLDPSASINVQGKGFYAGYSGPLGTGNLPKGAGGSHGGQGTASLEQIATYGALAQPRHHGGGGGAGSYSVSGCGGGVASINVIGNGKASINGTITANGAPGIQVDQSKSPTHGAGAGGSIFISANMILGSGTLTADGGSSIKTNCKGWSTCTSPSRHGGGGGRIALVGYTLVAGSFAAPGIFDKVHTFGGWGPEGLYSAAGTVWIQANDDEYGNLIVNNNGNSSTATTLLPMIPEGTVIEVSKTTITDYGKFVNERHVGWQVNPNVLQGSPSTLTDDIVATVLNNDVNKLYFNPKDKVDQLTEVGNKYRGFLRLDRLEIRGNASCDVSGDIIVLKGDMHSGGIAPSFNVSPGSKLTANIFEFPGVLSASITGNIDAQLKFCADCN